MNRLCISAALAATAVALGPITAQTHTRTMLVRGQPVSLRVAGAPATSVVSHWLGFQGLGRGICFPPPFRVCFDMPGTLVLLGIGVSDTAGRHELGFVMPPDAPLIRIASQALALDVRSLAMTKTNALDGPIRTLAALDDPFDGSALDPVWKFHDRSMQTHAVTAGELRMRPTKTGITSIWFEDNQGPFVYRMVRGDFSVTTRVSVVDPSRPTFPPGPTCRVAGLMLRDPASKKGKQNWVYLLLGGGISTIPLALEDKTTVDSKSQFKFWPVLFWSARLRVQRKGRTVSLSYQAPGKTTWTPLRSHDRPDFPATLQVGLVVFSLDAPPRVEARFDDIRFQ